MKNFSGPQLLAPAYIGYQIVGQLITLAVVMIIVIPIMFFVSLSGSTSSDPSSFFVGLTVTGFVFSIVILTVLIRMFFVKMAYKRFTYELKEDVFVQQQGVLNVTSVNIPYDRIQDVVIHRPFIMRWFGLSKLNIQNASGGSGYGLNNGTSLPGLEKAVAEKLQT